MRSKSTAKAPDCQVPSETPEQKEIRLLTKHLADAKAELKWYKEACSQEIAAHKKTKLDLFFAGKLVELYERSQASVETLRLQNQTLLSMYDKEKALAAEWKAKYQALVDASFAEVDAALANEKEDDGARKLKRMVYLICINTDVIEKQLPDGTIEEKHGYDLEYLERYTASARIERDGGPCYLINELSRQPRLCERFVLSTKQAHLKAKKK